MPGGPKSARRSVPIRILVADDHDVVRHCIKAILARREGWDVCAEAKSGPETIALAEKHRPDVMVMDLNMPGLGGVETLREVKRRVPSVNVVVLTLHYSDPLVRAIVDAGALG
jgi:DNA-binding NarL/FixJ family response regulator